MKERKTVIFNLRMTPEQITFIQNQASSLDLNISEYVRLLISKEKNKKQTLSIK
jgi:hypothetical protein